MTRAALVTVLALLAFTALAPLAQADYDPLGSGTTKLSLDKGFMALLKQNKVKLSASAPATLKGSTVTFPVTAGKFDPVSAKGTVEHEGALVFKAGSRSIPLKALQLKTTSKHTPLTAKVGGSQLKLAAAKSLVVSRAGFGDKVKVSSLTLSAKLATRLDKKLRLEGIFKEGQALGQTLTKAQPQTIAVLGRGAATLTLDPGIVAKLNSLFVAVTPIFPAEHQGPVFTLPIFGGTIAPDGSQGTIETQGAFEFLQLGGGQVFWHEAWIDPAGKVFSAEVDAEPSPPYGGKAGRVSIAGLGPGGVSSDPSARTVTVAGAPLVFQASTAQTFNEVFAKPQGKDGVFASGEAVGSVSFTAQGQ